MDAILNVTLYRSQFEFSVSNSYIMDFNFNNIYTRKSLYNQQDSLLLYFNLISLRSN